MSEEDQLTPEYPKEEDPRGDTGSRRRPMDEADSQPTWRVSPEAGETTAPWGQDSTPTTRMPREAVSYTHLTLPTN